MSLHVDPIPADRPFDAEALLAHVGWVRRLAHGLLPSDPHLADDLAQQTYLVALEKRPSTDRSLSGWLATVLANLKRQERRGSSRRADRERAVALAEAHTPDAGHDAKLAVHNELVQSVMSLAEPYRETIVLRYFEELSPTAIARKQNVPVATVKTRLARAIDQLRGKLDRKHGGDGRAWIAALVPFARPESGAAAVTMGALIVSTKLKVAVAVVIVCALITGWTVRTSRTIDADVRVAEAPSLTKNHARSAQVPASAESSSPSRRSVATSTPIAAGSRALEVTVVDESGTAVVDTPLLLLDADGATSTARTDEHGHATFPERRDRGTLFVKRAGDAPRRVELATSAGSQRVELAPMAEVSGVLRAKGLPPAELSSLTLLSDARLFPGVDLPGAVDEFLGLNVQGKYEDRRTTAQDGSFRFTGLPDSWSGRLLLTGTWVVVESQRKIDSDARLVALAKPKVGIVLEVERVPSVIGRVLDASGNPAAGAEVRATVSWDDTNTTNFGAHTDETGFFEVPLSTQELVHIRLEARGTGTSGSAQATRTREELGPRLDAGVLHLVQGSSLRVHVIDRSNRPIEGAIPIVHDAIAQPTDARGNSLIENVSSDAQMLRVVAKGYFAARIPLPAPDPQPLSVVLEPCNRLTLRLVRADGTPPRAVHVDLHLDGVLFPDTDSNVVDKFPEGKFIGTSNYSTRHTRTGESMVRFGVDQNGIISLEGVTHGIPIGLEVRDVTDSLVTSATIAPLGRIELREVTVALPDTAHALTVLVVDEKGQPVPNAQVTLDSQGNQQTYQYSDSDGRVRYEGVFTSEVTLRASKDGYARVRANEVHLTSANEDVKIVLEHGLQVHVGIVDAQSRPVTGGQLNVMDPQIMTGWTTRETGAGQYTLVDLPGHEIELQYVLAGCQYKELHDPHEPEARIVVPVHGQLVVTWTVNADRRHLVEVRPVDTTLYAVQSASSIQHAGETRFDYVLPGDYDVVLVEDPLGDAKGAVLASRRITVQADATERIALGP